MKTPLRLLLLLGGILLASCGKTPPAEREGHPALRLTLTEAGGSFVRLQLDLLHAGEAFLLVRPEGETAPSAEELTASGRAFPSGEARLDGLRSRTPYRVYGVAAGSTGTGTVESLSFTTGAGEDELYAWERARNGIPSYADLVLLYGSWRRDSRTKVVLDWDLERVAPLVSYTGDDGREHWLFEAFLALEGLSGRIREEGRTFGIGTHEYDGGPARRTAPREDALYFLDWRFRPGNGFDALDRAVGEAAARIGAPATPRQVLVMLPDLSIHERYDNLASATDYWAEGYDFSRAEDRVAACCWYVDAFTRPPSAGFSWADSIS